MEVTHKITRIINLMAAGVAVATAFLPPALYSYLSYQNCSTALKTEAEVIAPVFTGLVAAYPETWRVREVELRKHLSGNPGEDHREVRRIFDEGEVFHIINGKTRQSLSNPIKKIIRMELEVTSDVKGIVSSGYSNDPVMANFRSYGFKGIVPKPYRIEELSQVLHEVIACEKDSLLTSPA